MEAGRPRRRSAGLISGCCGSAVLIGIVLLIAFFPREPGLLDHAVRIARTETWAQGYGGYFWQSGKSLLAFHPSGSSVLAVNVSAETGSETPLSGLTASLAHGTPDGLSQWRLSPNGSLLIWEDAWQPANATEDAPSHWIVCSLDGVKRKTWTVPDEGSFMPLWFPDNRRWVEAKRDTQSNGVIPIIHNMDGKDTVCAPIKGAFTWPLAVTPEERLLTLEWRQMDGHITWFEYPLTPQSQPPVITSIPLPKGAGGLIEAEVSPQGDRIACLVSYLRVPPQNRLLKRFLPNLAAPEQTRTALWIFRRDGKESRMIGAENGNLASGLLWSPDGKHVSLYDHASLYLIPVE